MEKNNPLRVAAYLRVSSEDQAERGTIENQADFAAKYCDLHQLDIVEWYRDDGVTGTIPLEMREEGRRLLEDAKAGRFELLLIYRLDRLGRSARIILNAVYDLEQHGVKIRSMTEPFDTGDLTVALLRSSLGCRPGRNNADGCGTGLIGPLGLESGWVELCPMGTGSTKKDIWRLTRTRSLAWT